MVTRRILFLYKAPKEVVGNGKVEKLVCSKMQLGEPDASGRRSPVDTGETFVLDVDMVIKAAGQVPFEQLIVDNGIMNSKGKIVINDNYSTNITGVFAGGDAVNGGKEVVDAVEDGKEGARAILSYLGLA